MKKKEVLNEKIAADVLNEKIAADLDSVLAAKRDSVLAAKRDSGLESVNDNEWAIVPRDFVAVHAELAGCTQTLSDCTKKLTDALCYVQELTERETAASTIAMTD